MTKSRLISLLLYLVLVFPRLVFALPQGGEVVSGTVSINKPSGNDMAISQGTDQAIVNWQGFDIGQQESVNINQPNSNSVILNRVIAENPSEILGKLSANGRVFLTNPSGILFGQGAQVNVGALVASTLNISNQDFLDRNYRFTQDANKPLSSIINLGDINARSVGLLAPRVENRGTIVANLGSVAIASGEKAALDFEGDGLINFEITEPVSGEIRDNNGNVIQSGVVNSGLVSANGGRVVLSALQAQGMIQSVVNNEGMIEAKGVAERDGRIFLLGADEVLNQGTLDVSSMKAGKTGGTIHVLGNKVGVFGKSVLDASGDAGGGEILIGGDFQGKNAAIQNAYRTYVGFDAVIKADATNTGNGGKVIVWADDVARFYGSISATGGFFGGDGGFVETSGKSHLEFLGNVDITATNGNLGTLLLDPQDIIIADGSSGADDGQVSGDSTALFADGGAVTFTIAEQTLEALTGNIILQATQDITINDLTTDGVLNLSNLTSGESVVFQAGRTISFSNTGNTLSTGGGNIHLEADSPHSSAGAADGTGDLTVGILSTSGGSVTLIGSGIITLSGAITTGTGNVNIAKAEDGATLGVGVTDFTDTELDLITTTGTLTLGQATTAGSDGAGTSASTLNAGAITVDTVTNTTATNFTIVSNASITFSNAASTFSSGTLTIDANGTNSDVNINFDISTASGGAVNIQADDSVIFAASTSVTATGSGNVSVQSNTSTSNGDTGNVLNMDTGAINAGSGTITLTSTGTNAGNITLGQLTTTSSSTSAVNISAGASIVDGNAATNNVTASSGTVNMTAGTSIGSGNSLEVTTAKTILDANGSIEIVSSTTLTDLTITLDPGGGTNTYTISDSGNLTLSLTDSGTDLDIGGLSLSSGNLNFALNIDTGNLTTSGNIAVNSGSLSITTTTGNQTYSNTASASGGVNISASSGTLTVNSGKQIIAGGSSNLTVTAASVSLAGSTSSNENLQNSGSGNITVTSTGTVSLAGNYSIGLASTGTLTIDASGAITTTGSGSSPDIFLSGGQVRIVGTSIGSSSHFIRTLKLTDFAATATSGGIYIDNIGGASTINSTLISSTDGIVAAGEIHIKNATSGSAFKFSKIIKSNTSNITLASFGAITDNNGTATSLSAENGTVTVTISSSGDFGSAGDPIEIRAKGRSITLASGTIFDSFINTTPAAIEETTESTTTSSTTTETTSTTSTATTGTSTTGDKPLTPDDLTPVFGRNVTQEEANQINSNNTTAKQVGFVTAIENIVKDGC